MGRSLLSETVFRGVRLLEREKLYEQVSRCTSAILILFRQFAIHSLTLYVPPVRQAIRRLARLLLCCTKDAWADTIERLVIDLQKTNLSCSATASSSPSGTSNNSRAETTKTVTSARMTQAASKPQPKKSTVVCACDSCIFSVKTPVFLVYPDVVASRLLPQSKVEVARLVCEIALGVLRPKMLLGP